MKPALHSDYEIVVRNDRGYIVRRRDDQPLAALTGPEALLLALMDGRLSWQQLEALLGHEGAPLLNSVRSRLAPLFSNGVRTGPHPDLNNLGCLTPPNPAEGLRPIPGPKVLHWCVTRFCPRRCVYCYAEPVFGGRAPDATLSRQTLRRVFQEAASLGAEHLLAGGSEPFLRDDLPEVLGDALAAGIYPNVTTKHPISISVAERLATAGVRHISLSVDTLNEAASLELVGSAAYPAQVRESVNHLRTAGVAFSLQAVLVPQAIPHLEELASFAEESGAVVLQLSTFDDVRQPIAHLTNADLRLPKANAEQRIAELAAAHPGTRIELFDTSTGDGYHCDIGMTKLFFLPDGTVHRCYKLTADSSLAGLSLSQVSVARAWHDADFLSTLSPPLESYAGANCSSCGRFSSCHTSGRCIYNAGVRHGRYSAPDRDCQGPYPVAEPLIAIQPVALASFSKTSKNTASR